MNPLMLRMGPLSARFPARLVLVNAGLFILLIVLSFAALMRGSYPLALSDMMSAINGQADPVVQMIFLENRVPRVLTAVGVGIALGIAGEMVQTMLKNPLASPDILGFSAGASVGAILSVVLTGGIAGVLFGSFLGGAFAALLVVVLSWQGRLSSGQIVLTGIGIMVSLTVISELLLSMLEENTAAVLLKWLVGSFGKRSLQETQVLWVGLLIFGPLVLWHQFALTRGALHEELTRGLGIDPDRNNLITITLSVCLVAIAVATAGPLSFVAFVAGPIAHAINGAPRSTVTTAALVGATITLVADALSLSLPVGFALPAGVFTALIGAPVLIWVLLTHYRRQR